MLSWLARQFPLLRRVYLLPQLLDTLLLAHTLLRRPRTAQAMHALEKEVLAWPGVTTGIHRFGGTEFRLGRREIGHLHGHGLLDIPFTQAIRNDVVNAGLARPHHIFPRSAWVSFDLRVLEDVPPAAVLLRRSYDRWRALDKRTETEFPGLEDQGFGSAKRPSGTEESFS